MPKDRWTSYDDIKSYHGNDMIIPSTQFFFVLTDFLSCFHSALIKAPKTCPYINI